MVVVAITKQDITSNLDQDVLSTADVGVEDQVYLQNLIIENVYRRMGWAVEKDVKMVEVLATACSNHKSVMDHASAIVTTDSDDLVHDYKRIKVLVV